MIAIINRKNLLFLMMINTFMLISIDGFAQKSIGIGTDKPIPSAVLELQVENPATTPQGLLLPRLTTTQRTTLASGNIASLTGMAVYDLTDKSFYTWDGTQWKPTGNLFTTIVGTGGILVSFSGNSFTISGSSLAQWTSTGVNQISYAGNTSVTGTMRSDKLIVSSANPEVIVGDNNSNPAFQKQLILGYNVSGDYSQIQSISQGIGFRNLVIGEALATKIGIGTNSPNEKLTIFGNSSVSGTSYTSALNINFSSPPSGSVLTIDGAGLVGYGPVLVINNQWISASANQIYTNSFVGIGTNNPIASLDITQSNNVGILIKSTGAGNNGYLSISGLGSQQIYFEKSGATKQWKMGRESGTDDFRIGDLTNNYFNLTSTNDMVFSNLNSFYINNNFQIDANGNITKINNVDYSFPSTILGTNRFLRTDASGALSWEIIPSSQWITTSAGIYFGTSVGIGMLPITGNSLNVKSTGNSTKPIRVEYSGTTFSMFEVDQGSGGQGNMMMYDNAGIRFLSLGVNNNSFFNGSGNFGIGTINPNQKLTIEGNSSVSGMGYIGTIIGNNMAGAATGSVVTVDGTGKLGFGSVLTSSQWITTISGIYYTSNVGIGVTNPSAKFEVRDTDISNSAYNGVRFDLSQGGNLGLKNGLFLNYSVSGTGSATYRGITTNIIGSSSSTGEVTGNAINMNVSGSANISGFVASVPSNSTGNKTGAFIQVNGTGGATNTGLIVNVSGATTNYAALFNGGNVGIGTSSPTHSLDVSGTSSVSGIGYFGTLIGNNLSGSSGSVVTVDGAGKLGIGTLPIQTNYWESYLTNRIYTSRTVVGIGTSAPLYPLHLIVSNEADNGIYVQKNVTGTVGNQVAYSAYFTGVPSAGTKIGYESYVTPTANESVRGMSSTIINTNSNNTLAASFSYISNNGSGQSRAFEAINDGSGPGTHVGLTVADLSTGTGERYGVFVNMAGVSTSSGANYGIYSKAVGSSTLNYAGYFDDGNVYMKDNLGIGAANPTAKLDVNGMIRFRSYNTLPGAVLTVDGSGNLGLGIFPNSSNWISTSSGVSYTNDKVAVGINTVTGTGKFKVAGDGTMGGMVLVSQSLINPISTSNNVVYVTLLSIPVYIPAGTNNLRGNFIANSGTGALAMFRFKINSLVSPVTSTTNITPDILSAISNFDVSTLQGTWVKVEVQSQVSGGTDTAILSGFSLVVQD